MILAVEIFGQSLPKPGLTVVIVVLVIGFFLVNRNSPMSVGKTSRGPVRQCQGCGARFQPETVEVQESGEVRQTYDEDCPKCGGNSEFGT